MEGPIDSSFGLLVDLEVGDAADRNACAATLRSGACPRNRRPDCSLSSGSSAMTACESDIAAPAFQLHRLAGPRTSDSQCEMVGFPNRPGRDDRVGKMDGASNSLSALWRSPEED